MKQRLTNGQAKLVASLAEAYATGIHIEIDFEGKITIDDDSSFECEVYPSIIEFKDAYNL
jgi:hypothetical protein